ncbi:MAG: DUF2970 domain-containing protein [Alcaligenaceae bacterium]|jgi:hypothetical protein
MSDDLKELAQRKLSFFQTLKAVLWALFGVRKGAGYQDDIARLNPVHLIIAGIVLTVIFVVSLVKIAGWAISLLT